MMTENTEDEIEFKEIIIDTDNPNDEIEMLHVEYMDTLKEVSLAFFNMKKNEYDSRKILGVFEYGSIAFCANMLINLAESSIKKEKIESSKNSWIKIFSKYLDKIYIGEKND